MTLKSNARTFRRGGDRGFSTRRPLRRRSCLRDGRHRRWRLLAVSRLRGVGRTPPQRSGPGEFGNWPRNALACGVSTR
jgi:hypothetical protein